MGVMVENVHLYFSKENMILLVLVFIGKKSLIGSVIFGVNSIFQPDVLGPDAVLVLYWVGVYECEHMCTQCLQETHGRFLLHLGSGAELQYLLLPVDWLAFLSLSLLNYWFSFLKM